MEDIDQELETQWADIIGAAALEGLRRDLRAAIRASYDGELPAVRPPS